MLPPDTARVEVIAERIGPESFRDAEYRAIYQALIGAGADATLEDIAAGLNEDAIETVEDLVADKAAQFSGSDEAGRAQMNTGRAIEDSVARLRARDLSDRMTELDRMIPLATSDEKSGLMLEKQTLQQEMKQLGEGSSQTFKAFRRGRKQ